MSIREKISSENTASLYLTEKAFSVEEAVEAAKELGTEVSVVKAQITRAAEEKRWSKSS